MDGLELKQLEKDYQRILRALKKKKYSQALLLLSTYQDKRLGKRELVHNIHEFTPHFVAIQTAWCYFEKNQFVEAKNQLEQGLRSEPLDGPMNLFLAYIHLIEDNKPAAIHRYTILFDNPFYQEQVENILEKIRCSDSITQLLSSEPKIFFYKHEIPSVWKKVWLPELIRKLRFLSNIFKFKSITEGLIKTNNLENKESQTWWSPKAAILFKSRKAKKIWLAIFIILGTATIWFWKTGKLEVDKLNLQVTNNGNADEEVFNPARWVDYDKSTVEMWFTQYQLMKQALILRQFNEAIKIYNTINMEDIPIEIKNKFFILNKFLVNPQFNDLPRTVTFKEIDFKKEQDFFFKFSFRVLQSQKGETVKFLVELPIISNINPLAKNSAGIYMYRAILSIDEQLSNFTFFKPQTQYEAITRLFEVDRNYFHFKVTVARELVRANEP